MQISHHNLVYCITGDINENNRNAICIMIACTHDTMDMASTNLKSINWQCLPLKYIFVFLLFFVQPSVASTNTRTQSLYQVRRYTYRCRKFKFNLNTHILWKLFSFVYLIETMNLKFSRLFIENIKNLMEKREIF